MLAKGDQPSPDLDFEKSKLKKLRRRKFFFFFLEKGSTQPIVLAGSSLGWPVFHMSKKKSLSICIFILRVLMS